MVTIFGKRSLFGEEVSTCAAVHMHCVLCVCNDNSFASYDGDVICACHANKAACQLIIVSIGVSTPPQKHHSLLSCQAPPLKSANCPSPPF